ncbi:MAG: hypothetical protein Q8Q33_00125 [Chlamydiota bacterium]|nr:hypothetical protein [Chlamydiota bacterium]
MEGNEMDSPYKIIAVLTILCSLHISQLISAENNEIIIRFKAHLEKSQILTITKQYNLSIKEELLPQQRVYLCTLNASSKDEIGKLLESLNQDSSIEYAEPNWPVHAIEKNGKGSSYHETQ